MTVPYLDKPQTIVDFLLNLDSGLRRRVPLHRN
jgi:hypothetical protein